MPMSSRLLIQLLALVALIPGLSCSFDRQTGDEIGRAMYSAMAMHSCTEAFRGEHARPPANLEELERFAQAHDLPFDSNHWRSYRIDRDADGRMLVRYKTAQGTDGWFHLAADPPPPLSEEQFAELRTELSNLPYVKR